MDVTKRDGRVVPFDEDKICQAVLKAFKEVDGDATPEATRKASEIAKSIADLGVDMSVEEIQDAVEDKLMASKRKDVAKTFILYRDKRSRDRERNSQFMKTIGEKLTASNVQNQNANVDEHSFGGRRGEADSELMRKYALDYLLSDLAKERHLNNEIYEHDLDAYAIGMHNCVDGSSWISVRHDDKVTTTTLDDFADSIGLANNQMADLSGAGYQILSRDGWTKLNNIVRRNPKTDETIYRLKTRTGLPLIVTEDHRLPIIRDGEEFVEEARNIKIGDQLISSDNVQLSSNDLREAFLDISAYNDDGLDIRVFDVVLIRNYLRFKYGLVFNDYAKKKFKFWANSQQKTIKLEDFLTLIDDYPMSYEILSRLKIGANNSGHKYPLLIAYSSSLAKLYAYVYSDGHVYEKEDGSLYQISFANKNEAIIDDFIKCFESCFGRKLNKCYPSEEYAKTNSPCIRVHCGDRFIVRLFKKYAGGLMNGSGDLSVPDFIINGTKEIKYAYLSAAIDSDGSISSRNINIATCCKKYAEQLSMMINSLGYHSTIVKTDSAGSKYHFGNSNRTGTRNFDSYSVRVVRNDEMYDLYNHMSTIKYCDDYSYKAISHNFVESKIVDINVIEDHNRNVYDVETDSHWFIVNNYVSHNCLTIPFDKLLANGFNTRQTDVRPAQSINTAFQLVAVIFQIQSLQEFGGVSASHLDWSMVPYVRKSFWKHYKEGLKYIARTDDYPTGWVPEDHCIDDEYYKSNENVYAYALDMTTKEANQAAQGMFHNLNTLQSRSGNQFLRWLAS